LTRDRAQNDRSQVQQNLIDWRRSQVVQLLSKGKTLTQIAEILKVDRSTVSRDYQFIRENSSDVMRKYLVETVPFEITKFLARLNSISDEAWKMVEQADKDGDTRTKFQALSLAQKAALLIVEVVAGNKNIVDEGLKYAEPLKLSKPLSRNGEELSDDNAVF
jgi:transcription initiation factor TFIIIB Brf1 subunit/transcription initiation factor TFIIB